MDTDRARAMARQIQDELSGLSIGNALRVLSEVVLNLSQIVTEGTKEEYIASLTASRLRTPRKRKKPDPYAPVWEYLSTVEEYTSLYQLRIDLVSRFGERGTPSRSTLYRHIPGERSLQKRRE